ncbi:hypothetical protein HDU84_002163, partial [Entophlyctis sp. JEL0112]
LPPLVPLPSKETSATPRDSDVFNGGSHAFGRKDVAPNSQKVGASLSSMHSLHPPRSTSTSLTSVSGSSGKIMRYRVVESWTPQRFDELSLHVGDIANVYQFFEDGWCEGFIDGCEEDGMFPRICLDDFAISITELNQEATESQVTRELQTCPH